MDTRALVGKARDLLEAVAISISLRNLYAIETHSNQDLGGCTGQV